MATPNPSAASQTYQTPISSRFPLASAAHLIKERGTQKQRHTKLVNKIRSHVDQGGVTSEMIQLQKKTIEVLMIGVVGGTAPKIARM